MLRFEMTTSTFVTYCLQEETEADYCQIQIISCKERAIWSSQNLNNQNLTDRIFQGAGIVYINENLARMRRELFANSQKFEFINHAR